MYPLRFFTRKQALAHAIDCGATHYRRSHHFDWATVAVFRPKCATRLHDGHSIVWCDTSGAWRLEPFIAIEIIPPQAKHLPAS